MNIDISLLPCDRVTLLLSKHSLSRFTERFNCLCDLDNLNNKLNFGYVLKSIETRIYFPQNNMLVSVDDKELPDRTFAVNTFIPRHRGRVEKYRGIRVSITWGLLA